MWANISEADQLQFKLKVQKRKNRLAESQPNPPIADDFTRRDTYVRMQTAVEDSNVFRNSEFVSSVQVKEPSQ